MSDSRPWSLAFGDDAEGYDSARPSYPDALIEYLVADNPKLVADIGCGTGIAGRLLAARGCNVIGVEPDERMAAVASRHGIEVAVTTFETWQPTDTFDLATAAQSWHWVDRKVGPTKAAAILREGGRFAAFWNSYHLPAEMVKRFLRIYEDLAPELLDFSISLGLIQADNPFGDNRYANDLAASGLFTDVGRRSFWNTREYDATGWINEIETHSDHHALDPARKQAVFSAVHSAIEDSGGTMTVNLRAGLVTAIRV